MAFESQGHKVSENINTQAYIHQKKGKKSSSYNNNNNFKNVAANF